MKDLTIKDVMMACGLGVLLGFILIGIDIIGMTIEAKSESRTINVQTIDQEQIYTDLGIVNFKEMEDGHHYGICKRVDDNSYVLYDKTAKDEAIDKCYKTAHEILSVF